MILSPADSSEVAERVVMVDGSFDPLHEGHIEYFRRAAEFGFPVLCNIAPDSWTSQKHPIFLEQHKRAVIIDAIRFVSYVMVGGNSTAEILEAVRPKAYVKGSDWKIRGGIPENEQAICDRLQIEVFYLDTVLNSSSVLLHRVRAGNDK